MIDLPVRDTRKDEEGAADRSGKSHKTRGEQHSCTEIEVLGFPSISRVRVMVTKYLKIKNWDHEGQEGDGAPIGEQRHCGRVPAVHSLENTL